MRKQQIEAWAIRLSDTVAAGGKVEDAHAELKAIWPDPTKAARRIAGCCNAARGEPVLWVIGLDETKGITERGDVDLADWWAQVRSQFDEVHPALVDVVVPVSDGRTVHALQFDTDRAPYVVKNSSGTGSIDRDVPWREGTALRSAYRSDLIRVLVPLVATPQLHVSEATIDVSVQPVGPENKSAVEYQWSLDAMVYFTASQSNAAVFPDKRTTITVTPSVDEQPWENTVAMIRDERPQSVRLGIKPDRDVSMQTVHNGAEQLIVTGPGYAWVYARGNASEEQLGASTMTFELRMVGVDLPGPSTCSAVLIRRVSENTRVVARWSFDEAVTGTV